MISVSLYLSLSLPSLSLCLLSLSLSLSVCLSLSLSLSLPLCFSLSLSLTLTTISLYQVLDDMMDGGKILIFTATKRTADSLTRELRSSNFPARAIHGDKSQRERDWVLQEFRSGRAPLMIATDVASRGLGKDDFPLGFCVLYICLVPAFCRV